MVAKEHRSLLYLLVPQCFVFINSYTSREYLLVLGCFPIGTSAFGLQAGRRGPCLKIELSTGAFTL